MADSRPLEKLPLEVLLRITYFLDTPALCQFRLAGRYYEQAMYKTFVDEFFTRKQFYLAEESLQALIDISKSRLSPHLRIVMFGLERYQESPQRLPNDGQEENFRQRYANRFTTWTTGYHRDMLVEAFGNLKSLEDVVIRDFNSRRRSRDGPFAEWSSYGAPTALRETGVGLATGNSGVYNAGFPFQYSSQVFAAVLYSLAKADVKPKGIEVMSRNGNHLRDYAFNIPTFLEPTMAPLLESIEKLHLAVDMSWRAAPTNTGPNQSHNAADTLLQRFLLKTTGLKYLRINESHQSREMVNSLMKWLGTPTDVPSPPGQLPAPAFPFLEEVSFGMMSIEPSRLLEIAWKFAPTLKSLELWKVNLLRNPPSSSATGDPEDLPKVNFWAKFLNKLKNVPNLDLRHIKIGMMQQKWQLSLAEKQLVLFGENSTTDNTRAYTGMDWKHFIEEIVPTIKVKYREDGGRGRHILPPLSTVDAMDTNSDGSGDDDEDDEDDVDGEDEPADNDE